MSIRLVMVCCLASAAVPGQQFADALASLPPATSPPAAPPPPLLAIADTTANAFSYPSPLLDAAGRRAFAVGNAIFRSNWVEAPASTAGLDGLGPLFNARSCSSCHLRDGRSEPPRPDDRERHGLLLRIGVRRDGLPDAPHPHYGEQIQDRALPGGVAEATFVIQWQRHAGQFADGEAFELLSPRYELGALADGPLGDDAVLGGRTAPHLIGLGLLEAIPAMALLAHADPDDRDGDGISGRVHILADGAVGRFGWKATAPTVLAQTAAAFVHDMGITSPLQPRDPRTAAQRERLVFAEGGEPEIDAHKLARVAFYARTIAPPAPRTGDAGEVSRGAALFTAFGCAKCHTPAWTTGADATEPEFANRVFTPYTDLLLHDLGPGLADDKQDGDASPAEWRTAPLWGIGLFGVVSGHERLLHDGRARGVAEAILWHGGEGQAAREAFRCAAAADRATLVRFVHSL
jgi:CxxC motif-containing protein (DUF1111 family)